jgi:hypothetical protein
MECVEVVPLRKLLRLRTAESERENSGRQQRNDLDDHTSEITPEAVSPQGYPGARGER